MQAAYRVLHFPGSTALAGMALAHPEASISQINSSTNNSITAGVRAAVKTFKRMEGLSFGVSLRPDYQTLCAIGSAPGD